MKLIILCPSLVLFTAGWAAAQSFDVASVKVSESGGRGGLGGKPTLHTEPDSLDIRNMSLKSCVSWAYNVKDYQVSGPGWIEEQRYSILAKASNPVKQDELRALLRNLLAERFHLVQHRETRELSVYVLTVAKEGIKIKASQGEGESSFRPVKGNNKLAIEAGHTSMAQFAELLSSPMQRPVVDETGLTGAYDFTVDVSKYMNMEQGPRREGEGHGIDASSVESAIMMAIQEQLGLKLESKRRPAEMIVVDRAEKVPTEN